MGQAHGLTLACTTFDLAWGHGPNETMHMRNTSHSLRERIGKCPYCAAAGREYIYLSGLGVSSNEVEGIF